MSTLTPTPQPQAPPNRAALNQLNGLVDTSQLTAATGGTSGGSNIYGLSKDAVAAEFSLAGLPGLGSGQLTGDQLVNAFLAAGSSGDTTQAQVVAAIQHSLLYSGYYSKDYTPNFGVAKKQDAAALAAAVNDLWHANQSRPEPQSIAQWLSGQAAVAVAYGAGGAQAVAPSVVNVRAPNTEDVAAVYQKVAQGDLGHKPSAEETAAFVQTYIQSYVANEKANITAQYDATVQKAQTKIAQTTVSAPPAGGTGVDSGNLNPLVQQGGFTPTGAGSGNLNPNVVDGSAPAQPAQQQPDTLSDSMQSLQDLINQRSQEATGGDPATPGVIEAGTNAPESVDVAAENFARNKHPHEAAAGDLNNTFQQFLAILNGKIG